MTACNSSFSVSEHSYIFTAHIPNKSVEGHITSPVTVTACYGAKETEKKRHFKELLPITPHHFLLTNGRSMLWLEYIARYLTDDHQNPSEKSVIHKSKKTKHYLLQHTAQ